MSIEEPDDSAISWSCQCEREGERGILRQDQSVDVRCKPTQHCYYWDSQRECPGSLEGLRDQVELVLGLKQGKKETTFWDTWLVQLEERATLDLRVVI